MAALIVFRREVGQYLTSPFAYLIAAAVLLLTGVLFNRDLSVALGTRAADPSLVPTVLSFTMIFFAPLLTMRLFAEERREGTLELLLTAPVSDGSVVLGKFLGAWFYYSVLLLITFSYQIVLAAITSPDLGHAVSAYIGIWLYGGATLAVGILFSAATENQIVAAFLSMVVLMLLWLGDQAGDLISNIDVARVVRELSLQGHFTTSFATGLLRPEDAAFFAGVIAVALFITIRIIESNRWR
ncbi:MAG TPA: ABC transporter permease [Phototrophicaceae bacterium]|nr:ABC transporter permease [Phototrophicaceae bacterium]